MAYRVSMVGGKWKRFRTREEALAYANAVFQRTGNIVAVEETKGTAKEKNPVRGRYQKSIKNPTRRGTSHFVSRAAAERYYKDYEGSKAAARAAVDRKLRSGEIHIGPPALKAGERLYLLDGGTRYGIEEKNPAGSTRVYKAKRVRITQYPDGSTRVHIER